MDVDYAPMQAWVDRTERDSSEAAGEMLAAGKRAKREPGKMGRGWEKSRERESKKEEVNENNQFGNKQNKESRTLKKSRTRCRGK